MPIAVLGYTLYILCRVRVTPHSMFETGNNFVETRGVSGSAACALRVGSDCVGVWVCRREVRDTVTDNRGFFHRGTVR